VSIEAHQGRVQHLAAHVVEIHVDTVRRGRSEGLCNGLVLVVDDDVGPELLLDIGALLGPARDADDPTSRDLPDLHCDAADGARRRRDHHRIAFLRPADVEQTEVGGEARHAEAAHLLLERREIGVDRAQHATAHCDFVLRTCEAERVVAHREPRETARHDSPHSERTHHVACRDGLDVALLGRDPPDHRRIDRQILDSKHHLAIGRLGCGVVGELPGALVGHTGGHRCDPNLGR
jgi:hypothetical protein